MAPDSLSEKLEIRLEKGTLLVLFEYLSRNRDRVRKTGRSGLLAPDGGEFEALSHLEAAIERTLPEIFSPDYKELLGRWKQHLVTFSTDADSI